MPSTASSAPAQSPAFAPAGWRPRPVLAASLLYAAVTFAIVLASWLVAAHHFIYPLDDTYIGMAMAKNLAVHGVWGVTPYAFSSASSSLLNTLLLAGAYRLTGPNPYAPFLLSFSFGFAAIAVAGRMLASSALNIRWQTWTLAAFVLLTPLYVLGIIGLEHALHLLLTLLFLEFFLEPRHSSPAEPWKLGIVTLLMVATRYEGLFFLPPAFVLLLLARRWKSAMAMSVAGLIPLVSYAWASIANGAYWLPNSLLLKGVRTHAPSLVAELRDIAIRILENCESGAHLAMLVAGLAVMAWILRPSAPGEHLFRSSAAPLVLIVTAGMEHIALARVGWIFRYEDYLIGAGIVCGARALPDLLRLRRRPAFAAARTFLEVALGTLIVRCVAAMILLPLFSGNEYLQQWQMARFVHRDYRHASIAANDIGAIDWRGEAHCLDLVGLGSADIFAARRTGLYTTRFLADTAARHHVQIAIVFDSWFADPPPPPFGGPRLPATWIRVERWSIPHTLQSGDRVVSFYATDPTQAALLRSRLAGFDPSLPAAVTVMPN